MQTARMIGSAMRFLAVGAHHIGWMSTDLSVLQTSGPMGDIIQFPILPPGPTDYWTQYDRWAPGGYWATCETCKRKDCFHAGKYFIACEHHTKNKTNKGE